MTFSVDNPDDDSFLTVEWYPSTGESYCVDSGLAINVNVTRRCVSHLEARDMCYTSVRLPRCEHPKTKRIDRYLRCSDCGNVGLIQAKSSGS